VCHPPCMLPGWLPPTGGIATCAWAGAVNTAIRASIEREEMSVFMVKLLKPLRIYINGNIKGKRLLLPANLSCNISKVV
jgi:hypothetical protein